MKVLDIKEEARFSDESFVKKELSVTDNCKVLLICFKPGQFVDPCIMERSTAFYIVEGKGEVRAGEENQSVATGSIVLIEPDLERQILADSYLVVLALQYT